jgi:chemotaxis receptor (MCP) glutamine deamidase CheD
MKERSLHHIPLDIGDVCASKKPMKHITLHIGDLYASKKPIKIRTILGSCVAACLFDPSTGIGGMNHFLLPGTLDDPGLSTRYGVNAMEVLINEMMKLGARRKTLQAKIFGGGDIFRAAHPYMIIGEKNIQFVREFLETESIPVMASRVGGKQGLTVVCFPHIFDVFVKPITTKHFAMIEDEELTYRGALTQVLNNNQRNNITLF